MAMPVRRAVFCRFGICSTDDCLGGRTPETAVEHTAPLASPWWEAIKRDPAAPHRWCDLGDAFLLAGRAEEARYCFSNALALGPEIPPILVRSASFYHALQEDERALKLGARVLEKSDVYQSYHF